VRFESERVYMEEDAESTHTHTQAWLHESHCLGS
jgi:hypothetical protein